MNLDDLDNVTMLRNHRKHALALFRAAQSGFINVELRYGGESYEVFSTIPADPVRRAIVDAAAAFVEETETKLRALGVTIGNES